jgi:hypothetical protein
MFMNLFDPASLVWTLSPILFAVIATRNFQKAINVSNQLVLDVALLGMFIGIVGVMKNLESASELVPKLQLVFLPILYALILKGPLYMLSNNESEDLAKPEGIGLPTIAGIAFLGLTAMAMNAAAGIGAFIDISSIVVVFGGLLLLALLNQFFGHESYFKVLRLIHGIAVVAAVVGLILMLRFVDDPDGVRPAFAILYTVFIYSLMLRITLLLSLPDINEISLSETEQTFTTIVYMIAPLFGVWVLISAFS